MIKNINSRFLLLIRNKIIEIGEKNIAIFEQICLNIGKINNLDD